MPYPSCVHWVSELGTCFSVCMLSWAVIQMRLQTSGKDKRYRFGEKVEPEASVSFWWWCTSLSLAAQYELYFSCLFMRGVFFPIEMWVANIKSKDGTSGLGIPGTARWETGLLVLLECLKFINFAPVVPLLEIYSSEIKALAELKIFSSVFTAAFFTVTKKKIQKIKNKQNNSNVHQQEMLNQLWCTQAGERKQELDLDLLAWREVHKSHF